MIIPFPQKPRITITHRSVTTTTRYTAQGITVFRHDPPVQTYFVNYENGDDCLSVWDGPSRAAALVAAREWAAGGAVIRDRTDETWGRA